VIARDDLAERLAEHINHSHIVQCWPQDEQDAYHNAGSFAEGHEAVERIRLLKIADAALAWFEEQTTEEVAIRHNGTCYPQGSAWARELTERPYGETVEAVRRRVTAWEEAK
jgi:hypothetical protein